MTEKTNYSSQFRISLMQFFVELPNFLLLGIAALVTGSVIVWMDFLDSFGFTLRTGLVAVIVKKLSKNLKYKYNYGVGKVEAMSAIFCDGVIMCGLFIAVGVSVSEIIYPQEPAELIILAILLKLGNIIGDLYFFARQRRLYKRDKNALNRSGYATAYGALMFDLATLTSLTLVMLLSDISATWYISPVIAIGIAIYLFVRCIKRIKISIDELTDKTISEDEQMKILRVMSRHHDKYSGFESIKSRKVGETVYIDIFISFDDATTFEEIFALKTTLQTEIGEIVENSIVSISI